MFSEMEMELESIEKTLKTSTNEREIKKTLRNLIAVKFNYTMTDTLIQIVNGDYTVDIIANAALALCLSSTPDFIKELFNNASESQLTKTGKTAVALGIVTVSDEDELLFEIGQYLLWTDVGTHEKQTLLSARSLEKLSKKLSKLTKGMSLTKDLEFFIFSNLSSHLDAVKNLARNILQNLAIYYHQEDRQKFVTLVENVSMKPDHLKWISLLYISRCNLAFSIEDNLPNTLLSLSGIFRNSGTEIYATLMDRQINSDNFEETWIKPLFSHQNVADSNYKMKNDIIGKLVASKPLVLKYKEQNHSESENATHADKQLRLEYFQTLTFSKKTSQVIEDFTEFKNILKYNSLNQCPAFRQCFFSIFKKFARRLNDSYNLLRRSRSDLTYYNEFIEWLYSFLLDGLSLGSSFARRCISLNCLVEVSRYFQRDLNGVDYLHWIYDTYEVNKSMAVVLLSTFRFDGDCNDLKQQAMKLIESVRPPDSVSGKYLLKLLIKIKKIDGHTVAKELFEQVKSNYKSMKDLMQISCERPFYGYLNTLRDIIDNPDVEFIEEVVTFCLELDKTLFPVLGHSSPEGFLMDFEDETPRSLKAQKLLVCCWRSMKESTLLMSELVGKNMNKIPFSTINVIGEHLLYLLQNLMHRGVFEQVFVGYRLMAESLVKSQNEELKSLPNVLLEKTMNEDVLCSKTVTRRSGGVPFIFQALLNGDNIVDWVPRIVKLTRSENQIAIHTMNILRSLFRDANFSNHVMPFVPEGIQVAFHALNFSDWSIRNSGLMLFGAILRRSFGPKLNLMSSDMFFKKFPAMRQYLLEELTKITQDLTRFSTFHILLLISCFNNEKCSDMSDYSVLIRKCAASKDSQVRLVAAKALLPIVTDKETFVTECYDMILDKSAKSNNYIHGLLLQCLHLTRNKNEKLNLVIEKAHPSHYEVLYEIIEKTQDKDNFYKLNSLTVFTNSKPGNYNLKVKYSRARLLFELDVDNNIYSDRIIFHELLNHFVVSSKTHPLETNIIDSIKKRYLQQEFLTGDELQVLYLKFFLQNNVVLDFALQEKLEKVIYGRICICFPFAVQFFNKNCFSIKETEKYAKVLVRNLEGDEDVRLAIAQSVPLISELSKFESNAVKSLFWLLILTLSQDDELFLRQTIIEKNYGPICDSKGTELLVSDFCSAIKEYFIEGLMILLGFLLKDNFLFGFGEEEEDEKLFEKSESNMYFESVRLCKLFLETLKQHGDLVNVDENIMQDVRQLFSIASGVDDFQFSTLRNIIEKFPYGNQESGLVLKLLRDNYLK